MYLKKQPIITKLTFKFFLRCSKLTHTEYTQWFNILPSCLPENFLFSNTVNIYYSVQYTNLLLICSSLALLKKKKKNFNEGSLKTKLLLSREVFQLAVLDLTIL